MRMSVPGRAFADRFEFELDGAPEGISLGGVSSVESLRPQEWGMRWNPEPGRDALPRVQAEQQLGPTKSTERALEIALRCDAAKAKPGLSGNLIIQLLPRANPAAAQKGKPPRNQRRSPVGVLPAIPFEVVGSAVSSGL